MLSLVILASCVGETNSETLSRLADARTACVQGSSADCHLSAALEAEAAREAAADSSLKTLVVGAMIVGGLIVVMAADASGKIPPPPDRFA